MSIDRLLGVRAERSLAIDTLGRVIFIVLGRDQLLRRSAVLNPAHQGEKAVVLRVVKSRNSVADIGHDLTGTANVPGRVLAACTMAHTSNREESVKVIHLDIVRGNRRGGLLVEVRAGPERDDGIGLTVPVNDLAASLLECRDIEVVRTGISWINGFGKTNYTFVEGAPIVGLSGVQQ